MSGVLTAANSSATSMKLDANRLKNDFPILKQVVNGRPLVYLDSAATSQKPEQVLKAMDTFYRTSNANVARGVHTLAERATEQYERARAKVAAFIGARPEEIVFVRNSTEAINLVAYTYGHTLKAGDEVVSTVMEHHSNIVPWQLLTTRGVKLSYVDINGDGTLKLDDYDRLLSSKTKLVVVTHCSNVLGTINPVKEIAQKAHKAGALLLVDGAQSVPHMPINVKELGCDFFVFSGHKMLGPTGIGVLWARRELLEKLPPFMGGGDMIKEVKLTGSRWNEVPWKFEAGTPDMAGAIGLSAAIDYLQAVGMENIKRHEEELTSYALAKLSAIPGITIYGPAGGRSGLASFNLKGAHPHDVASIVDEEGIAIRSGHACAQPLMERLGVAAVCRASWQLYNTAEDIDALISAINKARKVLKLE